MTACRCCLPLPLASLGLYITFARNRDDFMMYCTFVTKTFPNLFFRGLCEKASS